MNVEDLTTLQRNKIFIFSLHFAFDEVNSVALEDKSFGDTDF